MSKMIEAGSTLAEGEAFAADLSAKMPGTYVTLYACFGLFAKTADNLNVFAPSDSVGDHYWLNGQKKPFTNAQRSADQRATPTRF
jgi:hypothetical protein